MNVTVNSEENLEETQNRRATTPKLNKLIEVVNNAFNSIDPEYLIDNERKIIASIVKIATNNPYDYLKRIDFATKILAETKTKTGEELKTLIDTIATHDGSITALNKLCENFGTYNLAEIDQRIEIKLVSKQSHKRETDSQAFDLEQEYIAVNDCSQKLSKNGGYLFFYHDPLVKESGSEACQQLVKKLVGILFKDRQLPDFTTIKREAPKKFDKGQEIEIEEVKLKDVFSKRVYKEAKLKNLENVLLKDLKTNDDYQKLEEDFPEVSQEVLRFKEIESLLENARKKDLRYLKAFFLKGYSSDSKLLGDKGKTIYNWYKEKLEEGTLPAYIENTYYRFISNLGNEKEIERNRTALIAYHACTRVVNQSVILNRIADDIEEIDSIVSQDLEKKHPLYQLKESNKWDKSEALAKLRKLKNKQEEVSVYEGTSLLDDFSVCGINIADTVRALNNMLYLENGESFEKLIRLARRKFQKKITHISGRKTDGVGYEWKKDSLSGSIPKRLKEESTYGRAVEVDNKKLRVLEHNDLRATYEALLLSDLGYGVVNFGSFSIKTFRETLFNSLFAEKKAELLNKFARKKGLGLVTKENELSDAQKEALLEDFFTTFSDSFPDISYKKNIRIIGFEKELNLSSNFGKSSLDKCINLAKKLDKLPSISSLYNLDKEDISLLANGFFSFEKKESLENAAKYIENLDSVTKEEILEYRDITYKLQSRALFIGSYPEIPENHEELFESNLISKDFKDFLDSFKSFNGFQESDLQFGVRVLGLELNVALKKDCLKLGRDGSINRGKIRPSFFGIKNHNGFKHLSIEDAKKAIIKKDTNFFNLEDLTRSFGKEMTSEFINFVEEKSGEKLIDKNTILYHLSIVSEFFIDLEELQVNHFRGDNIFQFKIENKGKIIIKVRDNRSTHGGLELKDVPISYLDFIANKSSANQNCMRIAKLGLDIKNLSSKEALAKIKELYLFNRDSLNRK